MYYNFKSIFRNYIHRLISWFGQLVCCFPAIYIYGSVHFPLLNSKKFNKHKRIKIHEINKKKERKKYFYLPHSRLYSMEDLGKNYIQS